MTKHFSKLFWVKIFEELVKPWVKDTDEVVNIKLKVFAKFSFDFFIDHKFNLINKLASWEYQYIAGTNGYQEVYHLAD